MEKNLLVISLVIALVSGCSTPMSSALYSRQASLLMHMERCKKAGYLSSYDYSSGFEAMMYLVNTWDFDEEIFKKEFYEISLRWGDTKATSYWCEGTKKEVDDLIAEAKHHDNSQVDNPLQAMAIIAQSLQVVEQTGQQIGQQATGSMQNMQIVSPTVTFPDNINTNVLPAPSGYEKTFVPSGMVGILRNSSISNGAKLCEYSNDRAIRIQLSETCPNLLKP